MKYKTFSILGTILVSLILIAPNSAHAQQAGCFSTSVDGGGSASGAYVQPVNLAAYPKTNGCPLGSGPQTASGVSGTAVSNGLTYTQLEPLPGETTTSTDFCGLLNLFFKAIIYLGGMIAVLYLVLGGITYMVSEVIDKRSQARERIKAAVWGLLILVCSYLILYTINPALLSACTVLGNGVSTGVVQSQASINAQQAAAQQVAQETSNAVAQCQASSGLPTVIAAGGSVSSSCSLLPSCNGWNPLKIVACCDVTLTPTNSATGVTCSRVSPL